MWVMTRVSTPGTRWHTTVGSPAGAQVKTTSITSAPLGLGDLDNARFPGVETPGFTPPRHFATEDSARMRLYVLRACQGECHWAGSEGKVAYTYEHPAPHHTHTHIGVAVLGRVVVAVGGTTMDGIVVPAAAPKQTAKRPDTLPQLRSLWWHH